MAFLAYPRFSAAYPRPGIASADNVGGVRKLDGL